MTVVPTLMVSSLLAFGQAVNPPPEVQNPNPNLRPVQQQGQRGRG